MAHPSVELPTGLAGLQYQISQVSLAVEDIDALVRRYHRAFGWAPWKVFDHVPPMHHGTERHGVPADFSLRGAEVQVGSLNFELLQPLSGANVWQEYLDANGEGIASIATMFLTEAEGAAVKRAFDEELGIGVTLRARIGPHIEYYYLDTQADFGCLIESGSGHALDFVTPTYEWPSVGATPGPSPAGGISYPITQVSVTVGDLESKLKAYHRAFGWGPWRIYESSDRGVLDDCRAGGAKADFRIRWAETMVGDMNFELVQPLGGSSPWQDFHDRHGDGISSVSVAVGDAGIARRVRDQFAADGIGVAASGRIGGGVDWFLLDSELAFKCMIKSGTGHGADSNARYTVWGDK